MKSKSLEEMTKTMKEEDLSVLIDFYLRVDNPTDSSWETREEFLKRRDEKLLYFIGKKLDLQEAEYEKEENFSQTGR